MTDPSWLDEESPRKDYPRVAELMRHFRDRARLSQADLQYYSRVQSSVIADIERGKVTRPQDGTIERLARGFVNPDNPHAIDWLTDIEIADLLKEARDNRPTAYAVEPELIAINDILATYPDRQRRAVLAFLVALNALVATLIATINKPSKHDNW